MAGVGYLGPRGTFTQEALEASFSGVYSEEIPFPTVPDVLGAVQTGRLDAGLVPIENSIEGAVNVTVDTLAFETDLVIEAEVIRPVRHCLLARPGVTREQVSAVVSHPQATAQCRGFLARWFSGVPVIAANSTAEAAMAVAESSEPEAAIGTALAGEIYGLETLDCELEDYAANATRFVLVGKRKAAPTGRDKTSIVCFIRENRPGSLLEILQVFASRGINLTKIESRPTKKVLGEYYFFIDIEGHIEDPEVAVAIGSLVGSLRELKLLGSYPAAT
ncbi:MAG: prephenate dehydratase [Actinobacteria bacterium]|nr:prephenate dehydratase [Actinomycetota bacterium]MBU2687115.1 prephenate dehydratase [Actinomycetota bacterium]